MTESHSPKNLLNEALSFYEHEIITSWNESLRSLKATDNPIVFQQAAELGLIDGCVDSIISKAIDNPLLIGEPIKNPVPDDEDDDDEFNGNVYKPNARRKLFVIDWKKSRGFEFNLASSSVLRAYNSRDDSMQSGFQLHCIVSLSVCEKMGVF